MTNLITLKNTCENGDLLQAELDPLRGMNLVSFKRGNLEAFDLSTRNLFEERFAGLGALIGPHFHHRKKEEIQTNFDTSIFPHIKAQKQKGVLEPFSHGIARYVPWKYDYSDTQVQAKLSSKDMFHGIRIKEFEGQDFEMSFQAMLVSDGLILNLSIQSEKPSVVGFHYYYAARSDSLVQAYVEDLYRDQETWKKIPTTWKDKHKLVFPLNQVADYGFKPFIKEEETYQLITLKNSSSLLHVEYTSSNEKETSWQLYRPENASFCCIEPLSALNPRAPFLTSSNLQVKLSLFFN